MNETIYLVHSASTNGCNCFDSIDGAFLDKKSALKLISKKHAELAELYAESDWTLEEDDYEDGNDDFTISATNDNTCEYWSNNYELCEISLKDFDLNLLKQ